MFSMMMRYDARDVGRKDILLGIVTENINMMGSNCQGRESDGTDICR